MEVLEFGLCGSTQSIGRKRKVSIVGITRVDPIADHGKPGSIRSSLKRSGGVQRIQETQRRQRDCGNVRDCFAENQNSHILRAGGIGGETWVGHNAGNGPPRARVGGVGSETDEEIIEGHYSLRHHAFHQKRPMPGGEPHPGVNKSSGAGDQRRRHTRPRADQPHRSTHIGVSITVERSVNYGLCLVQSKSGQRDAGNADPERL